MSRKKKVFMRTLIVRVRSCCLLEGICIQLFIALAIRASSSNSAILIVTFGPWTRRHALLATTTNTSSLARTSTKTIICGKYRKKTRVGRSSLFSCKCNFILFVGKFVEKPHLVMEDKATAIEHVQYNKHNKLIASIGFNSVVKVGRRVSEKRSFPYLWCCFFVSVMEYPTVSHKLLKLFWCWNQNFDRFPLPYKGIGKSVLL